MDNQNSNDIKRIQSLEKHFETEKLKLERYKTEYNLGAGELNRILEELDLDSVDEIDSTIDVVDKQVEVALLIFEVLAGQKPEGSCTQEQVEYFLGMGIADERVILQSKILLNRIQQH